MGTSTHSDAQKTGAKADAGAGERAAGAAAKAGAGTGAKAGGNAGGQAAGTGAKADAGAGKQAVGTGAKADAGAGGQATNTGAKTSTGLGEMLKKLAAVLGPTELTIGCGLGCMLAWVPMAFQSLNIVGQAGENVLDLVYLISIVALTATFWLIALTYKTEGTFISKQPVRIASIFGMALSTAFIALAANMDPWSGGQLALTWAAGILSGVSSAVFLMQFGMLISKFNTKSVVAITALGYVVSSALFCLFSFFGQMESCVFAVSMPLISGILRTSGANTAKGKHLIQELATPRQTQLSDPSEHAHLAHLTRALALCAALVGFTNELARTLYIQMGIVNMGNGNYALVQAAASLVVGLGATLLTIALLSMRTARAPEYCYRVLMMFLALGALLLPTPMLLPQVSVVLPYALNAAAYQCFGILAWVLTCGVCQRYPSATVRTFAAVRAGWAAGPLVGLLLGRFVVESTNFNSTEVYLCAVVGTVAIFLVSGLAFTERDLAVAVNLLPTDRRRRFTNKCLSVAARCGLTQRETEIMTLFAKGRNLAYIQEELCLSKSTVSTHRQHIYQKLGVHSSQEMIDLIQEEKV